MRKWAFKKHSARLSSLLFGVAYLNPAAHIFRKQMLAFTIARPFEQSHLVTFIPRQAPKFNNMEHSFSCTTPALAGQQAGK